MTIPIERPALYYPYIHIRSEHWLKATLLCAPAVKRIVPETYVPEDVPRITKYTKIVGPNGALLQSVPSDSMAALEAQNHLLAKMREHEIQIVTRYQRSDGSSWDAYWIHEAKFTETLLQYLCEHKLAWRSDHPGAYGHRTWYALHPVLGSAIMTTLGLSIAREQRYDVVTPSSDFHEALLATREDDIFEALLSSDKPEPSPTLAQANHDLGQLVINLTGINYESLRPEDIPELQSSKHFVKFQQLIRMNAHLIERDADPKAYHDQLISLAKEIIDAWHESKLNLSKDLRDALFESGLRVSGEALKALVAGGDATGLAAAGGVAIGLLMVKVRRLKEKRPHGSPYQYLTEVTKAEDEILRMTFPLGLEPYVVPT